jgi:hypothetical protein
MSEKSNSEEQTKKQPIYAGVGLILGSGAGFALGGPVGAGIGAAIGLLLGAGLDSQKKKA